MLEKIVCNLFCKVHMIKSNSDLSLPVVELRTLVTCVLNSVSPSGSPVQQIGLSVPVIIIKQEEACQCQCACRDSAKDKATSKKECPSPETKASEQPAPQLQPQTFPSSSPSPSCGQSSQIVTPSDSQTETLSAMDVSDYLSLQSPETPSNIIPIEALLQGEEEIGLNSSFSK